VLNRYKTEPEARLAALDRSTRTERTVWLTVTKCHGPSDHPHRFMVHEGGHLRRFERLLERFVAGHAREGEL